MPMAVFLSSWLKICVIGAKKKGSAARAATSNEGTSPEGQERGESLLPKSEGIGNDGSFVISGKYYSQKGELITDEAEINEFLKLHAQPPKRKINIIDWDKVTNRF